MLAHPLLPLLGQPQFGFRQSEVVDGNRLIVLFYGRVGLNQRELVAFLRQLAKTPRPLEGGRHGR